MHGANTTGFVVLLTLGIEPQLCNHQGSWLSSLTELWGEGDAAGIWAPNLSQLGDLNQPRVLNAGTTKVLPTFFFLFFFHCLPFFTHSSFCQRRSMLPTDTSWMGRWAAREEKNQVVLFLAISTLGLI